MGQLYALATPNEESANGLGGLSVMLSVILMGFLLSYQAMPDGWKWAYWANLFHYILQGLVTNELANTDYHLDLGPILEGVQQLSVFDGADTTQKEQLSSLLALVSEIPGGDGTNPDSSNLSGLIDCTLANGCFADEAATLSAGFIDCYLFSGLFSEPPCNEQFTTIMSTVDLGEIGKCFLPGDDIADHFTYILEPVPQDEPLFAPPFNDNAAPTSIHRQLQEVPGETANNPIPEEDKDSSLDFVLCIVGAILPADAKKEIMNVAYDLFDIAGFVFDVIENGINIPGELILYVFGWATYSDDQGFVAPYKWWYCIFAVAVFLLAIEIFKLIAVRFIVWTKR